MAYFCLKHTHGCMRHIYVLLSLLLLSSCEGLVEYHPHQIILDSNDKGLTAYNLSKLYAQTPSDTLKVLVMGDTQRFYDAAEKFVESANQFTYIDFVIHQGDISDFGMSQEFRWVHDIMKKLKWPYLTVIGNHDMLGNARKVYQEMYGSFNYSFVYGLTKFIFLDTNGREYKFKGQVPDLNWLKQELTPAASESWKQAIVVSHVPPFDADFDKQLEAPYHKTLADSKQVLVSLHGHQHSWDTKPKYDEQVNYYVTTTVKKRGYSYLKIWNGGYEIKRIDY